MTILGFPVPMFVLLQKKGSDTELALTLTEKQQAAYTLFCNDLLQRVSVSVYEAMLKANQYVAAGLNGVKLDDTWNKTYHDLIAEFTPADMKRLEPATEEQIKHWSICL